MVKSSFAHVLSNQISIVGNLSSSSGQVLGHVARKGQPSGSCTSTVNRVGRGQTLSLLLDTSRDLSAALLGGFGIEPSHTQRVENSYAKDAGGKTSEAVDCTSTF
jgi:hypothetical protein